MPKGRFHSSSSESESDFSDDGDPDFDSGGAKGGGGAKSSSKTPSSKNGAVNKVNGANGTKKTMTPAKDKNTDGAGPEEDVFANYSSYVPGTGVFTAVPDDEDDDGDDDDHDAGQKKRHPMTRPGASEGGGGKTEKKKKPKGKPAGPKSRKSGTAGGDITDLSIPFSRTEGLSFEGDWIPKDPSICFICREEFDDYHELTRHCERRHDGSGWNKHQCPICGKQFKSAGYRTHVDLVHLKVRNYRCDDCLRFFFTRHDMIRHQNGAHKNIAFSCQLCEASYGNDGGLRAHYRKVHDSRIEMIGDDFVSAKIIPLSEDPGRSGGGGGGGGGKGGSRAARGKRGASSSSASAAAVAAMEAIFNNSGSSGGKTVSFGGARRAGKPSRGSSGSGRGGSGGILRGGPSSRSRSGVKFKSRTPTSFSSSSSSKLMSITLSSDEEEDDDDDDDDDGVREHAEEYDDGKEVDDDEIDNLLRKTNGVQKKRSNNKVAAGSKRSRNDSDDEEVDDDDDDDENYRIPKPFGAASAASAASFSSTKFSSAMKPKTLNYECVTCGRRFTLRHLLEFHLTKQHGVSSDQAKEGTHWKVAHVCRDCDAQFQGEEDLEIHRQRMHGASSGGGGGAGGAATAAASPVGGGCGESVRVVPRGKARRSRGGGGAGVFRGASTAVATPSKFPDFPLVPAPLPPPKKKMTPSGKPASKWAKRGGRGGGRVGFGDEDEDDFSDEEEDDDDDSDFEG